MNADQVKQLLTNIITELNAAADTASVFAPQITALVTIGKVIDKQIPGLAATVTSWIQGTPPTEAEIDDNAQKLAILNDPNQP